ncbi:MAG: hypothetical protein CL484_15195 [Acidobacteria bacterium]|nr:hypothetical protein [Acidobacteriota bacterium]|tara:strand:+ start:223 stop:930 length:708 start_codon:yes stop_codon:yes gene_type:complete
MPSAFVSVIVPVLHDAKMLAPLLAELVGKGESIQVEVVVTNGDAEDRELEPIRRDNPKVRWVDGCPGRALQMNRGALIASGRWLLFLHSDARLGPKWFDEIERAARVDVVGGCYRLEIDSCCWQARLIEFGVKWRARWLAIVYGDQGIFIRRDVFDLLGGYRPLPLMEDADLVRRMRQRGSFLLSQVRVRVSARRWERDGWWRRTFANIWILLSHLVGRAPENMAESYPAWPQTK